MADARGRNARGAPFSAPGLDQVLRAVVARGGSAARHIADRDLRPIDEVVEPHALTPGETVTLLAPVAEALALVHALGWAHGSVGLDAIALDARRTPVLVFWSNAERAPEDDRGRPGTGSRRRARRRARRDPRDDDLARLRALARDLLTCGGIAPADVDRVLRSELDARDEGARAIAEALFTIAQPRSLMADARAASVPNDAPLHASAGESAGSPPRRGVIAAMRRRPLLVAAAITSLTAACSILALPVVAGDGAPETAQPPPPATDAEEAGGPAPSASAPDPGAPDAPLEGAIDLIDRRNACIDAGDPACLVALYAPDAPGLDVDLATLEHPAGAVPIRTSTCALTDRARHIALISCTGDSPGGAADHLVTVQWLDDGWRLREVRLGATP